MNESDILAFLRRLPLTRAPASLDARFLRRPPRRNWPPAAAAVLLVLAACFTLRPNEPVPAAPTPQEFSTGPEERLQIDLPDGTVARLNERSWLRVEPDRWTLLQGELWAHVAPRSPALEIVTPSGTARIVGTEFNLRAGPQRTLLAVASGTVRLGEAKVTAGQQAQITPGQPAAVQRLVNRDLVFRWARLPSNPPRHGCEKPMFRREPAEGSVGALVAQDAAIDLIAHRIDVKIEDDIATTTIEEVFFNTTDRRLEGTFVFPLPKDASISRFAMTISGDRWMEGQIVEKERARSIYQEIVRRMTDPGLLEWLEAGNQFSTRIFPIEPRQDKRILISYTQTLPVVDGRVRYVYPLASDLPAPDRFELSASVSSNDRIENFACPSHHIDVARATERLFEARLEARRYKPQNDFVLEYSVRHRPAISALRHGDLVAIRFRPEIPGKERGPGRTLFWIDSSRSMAGGFREIQQMFLEKLLGLLGAEDRFQVMTADSEVRFLFDDYVAPTAENLDRAAAAVWSEEPLGASDIERALLILKPHAGVTLVYIGDGVATCGRRDAEELAKIGIPAERFYAIAVGNNVQEQLLRRLGASVLSVTPGESLSEKVALVSRLLKRPAGPIKVQVEGMEHLYPSEFASVIQGEERVVFGLVRGERAVFSGTPIVKSELPVNPRVERLWVQRHIQELLSRGDREGAIALSQAYGIMTPYTSFLVLETEEDYRKHNIPLRNGATAEGVPRNWEKVIEEYKSRRSDTTSIADEWEKRMREFQGREQVRREEAEHMAQEHYRIAERFFQEGRLESAELACREALTLNPGHAGARALQYETQLLMGRGKAAPQSERLEKAIRQTEARQKEVQQEIDEQFNLGMRHYNAGNYGDAERSFRLILAHAKWVFPPNAEIDARRQQAAEMLEKTRKAETQRDLDNGRTMDRQIATIKGQIIETMIRIRAGERFLAAREYEKALAEFEEAEVQILAMPEQVPEKGSFLPVVKEYKKRTKDAIDEHVKIHLENERKKNEEIQKIQPDRDIEIDRYRDHIGKIIAEKNSSIQELQYLRKELERASHDMISPEGAPVKDKRRVEEAVEELRRRGTDSPKGPSAEPIEFPDRIAWQKASRRAREGVLRSIEEMEEPETVTDVGRKLHSKKVDMNCTDEPLENVLAFLREHTGLIILVDPEAGIDLKQPAGLKVKQASAWSALNHLLQQIDAQATITEDKVIMITRPPMTQPADQIDRLLKTLERGTLREQQDAIRRLVEAAKSDIPVEPALRALDGVTRFAPDVPEHWFLLARVYRKAGMPAQARRAALTPIEMQPEDPTLRAQIVQALKEIGEMGAACAELRNLCRLRPDEPGPHFELARMEIDRKNWPAAEDGYLQLIRRGVAVDEARADLAELYRKMASAGGVKIDALRDRMDPLVRALLFRDVKITLTWDLAPDVDLWVTAPGDELCKHTHLRTSRGGRLQRDILGGRGPEIYTFPDALPGRWLIQVRLFTGARAAGKVEIVLFEGTPEERRASIPFVLEREKETVTLLDGELPR